MSSRPFPNCDAETIEVSDNATRPNTPTPERDESEPGRGGDVTGGLVVRPTGDAVDVGGDPLSAAAAAAAQAADLGFEGGDTTVVIPSSSQMGDEGSPLSRGGSGSGCGGPEEPQFDGENGPQYDADEEEDEADNGTKASEPSPPGPPRCESTGLYFPSSSAMELLEEYDDGLRRSDGSGSSSGPSSSLLRSTTSHAMDLSAVVGVDNGSDAHGEPVFCRICREGLHDVNYDLDAGSGGGAEGGSGAHQPVAAAGGGGISANAAHRPGTTPGAGGNAAAGTAPDGAAIPPPPVVTHHPFAENPLLAPCECAGSMAFVHYLCVEQWRCRSRHPAARDGLNCETCGGTYALPPPPSRPASRFGHGEEGRGGGVGGQAGGGGGGGAGLFAEDDWLDAMPPHVLAALRRPHPGWQVGAAIVRRRWLRPLAPVVASPLVALYCRARRSLKKRGVSRRRWACSLCRRRARWKCVRCLRSYYCSRQCQNVSWHIVHKHVCYKPVRFWWSVVLYGVLAVAAFPGVLTDPAVYDLGASCLILSFHAMGVLGGGLATALKKRIGVDVRGRCLEMVVVVLTLWLTAASWGCVWGYFGDPSRCGWGTLGLSGGGGFWGGSSGDGSDGAIDVGDIQRSSAEDAGLSGEGDINRVLGPVLRLWRIAFGLTRNGLSVYDGLWLRFAPSTVASLFCVGPSSCMASSLWQRSLES